MSIDIKISKPIVLVGMMGCGKSYVGQRLASGLGFGFYDTDSKIEKDQNMSVAEIFSQRGEGGFRDLEVTALKDLILKGNNVISTGGGVITTPENLEIIKEKAISIWLKSDVDMIMERIKDDKSRPLLQNDNPQQTLQHLLKLREPLYSMADIHIENKGNIETVINMIMQELSKYNEAI